MRNIFICLLMAILSWSSPALTDHQWQYATMDPSVLATTAIECTVKPLNSLRTQSRPHMGVGLDTTDSTNWSGYVAATNLSHPANHIVNAVAGSWTVPALSASEDATYVALWVGIDGFTNGSGTVEQTGTEHDWTDGGQVNYAWFEMFPGPSYEIEGFPLNIGDQITGQVTYVSTNTFRLTLINLTQSVHFTVPRSYTRSSSAKRNSAEWIAEAPYDGGILPLAHFGTVEFFNCTAQFNQRTGSISNSHWHHEGIQMVTESDVIKATPSSLSSNGKLFSITWEHE